MSSAVASTGGIALDEARSALATMIGQIIRLLRTFVEWCLTMFSKLVTWIGQHPEATILTIGNVIIWMT